MFVLYTSNERLFKHSIAATANGLPQTYWSQIEGYSSGGSGGLGAGSGGGGFGTGSGGGGGGSGNARKRVSAENLEAVRARFLEMFIHKPPKQDPQDLEACSSFSRENFIYGMIPRVFDILERHPPGDFHSLYLPTYLVCALAKHLDRFEEIMCLEGEKHNKNEGNTATPGCSENHRQRLENLVEKFKVTCL